MANRIQFPPRAAAMLKLIAHWCSAELKSAMPWIERILLDPQPRALVLSGPERTTVVLKDIDVPWLRTEVFDTTLDLFSAEQREKLLELCAKRELSLSVAAQDVLCLQMQLPKGTIDLQKSISYRLLTDSPLDSAGMVFDARRSSGSDGREDGMAEVALCRRSSLDRLKACAEKQGMTSFHIGLSRDEGIDLAFVFERARGVKTASSRLHRNMLLAFGPVLTCILLLSATWMYAGWAEKGLRKDITALSARTNESVRLLARQAYVMHINKAIADDLPKTGLSQILNDLSKTLPQSAWLSEIRVDGDKLKLVGNGTDSTAVARAVAATPNLAAVRLDSVTSGIAVAGASRFEITAEIAAGRKN